MRVNRPTSLFTQFLSSGSSPVLFCHGTLRPQKPYDLLGTGEVWDSEWEPRPTSLFTQILGSGGFIIIRVGIWIMIVRLIDLRSDVLLCFILLVSCYVELSNYSSHPTPPFFLFYFLFYFLFWNSSDPKGKKIILCIIRITKFFCICIEVVSTSVFRCCQLEPLSVYNWVMQVSCFHKGSLYALPSFSSFLFLLLLFILS